ncbi:hypothetical protein [Actinoplanes sp. M2I2]|uniref:hypothetical protein n=1 Tax=Actinoplanes sp. M2I2 TaxID=1734444 RepID=UPI0020222920|nr:hypothetical protein [Actinoplanes sp. M2I2]
MRRLASVALSALSFAALPSAAAQAAPVWRLDLASVSVEPGGEAKALRFFYSMTSPAGEPGGTLVFDLAAVSAIATVTPWAGSGCTTSGTTLTCPGTITEAALTVAAQPGATLGANAQVTARAVVDGRTRATATGRVTIAEQVSLSALQVQSDISLQTGASTGLAASVRNTGTDPVTGVVLQLSTVRGFATAAHSNCAPVEFGAACFFDTELAPGSTYRLATPWQLTAAPAVWAPSEWFGNLTWHTTQDWVDLGHPVPSGSGPELELEPAGTVTSLADPQTETETGRNDNSDTWRIVVTGVNQSNFTAKGATAKGKVGKTVAVRVGVRNNGPARIEGYGAPQGSYVAVTVTPPAGTTVVKHSPLCEQFSINNPAPGVPFPDGASFDDGNYYCFTSPVEGVPYLPGKTVTFDFTLRLDKPGTLRGTVKAERSGPPPAGDPVPADDTAAIVIKASAPNTGGSGDGDNGGDSDDSSGGGQGGGGSLPITGSDTAAVALFGLVLLVAGAAARVATRRR